MFAFIPWLPHLKKSIKLPKVKILLWNLAKASSTEKIPISSCFPPFQTLNYSQNDFSKYRSIHATPSWSIPDSFCTKKTLATYPIYFLLVADLYSAVHLYPPCSKASARKALASLGEKHPNSGLFMVCFFVRLMWRLHAVLILILHPLFSWLLGMFPSPRFFP